MKYTLIMACALSVACMNVQCMESLLARNYNAEEQAPLQRREAAEADAELAMEIREELFGSCDRLTRCLPSGLCYCLGAVVFTWVGLIIYAAATENPALPYNVTQ